MTVDVRCLPYMPLHIERLRRSKAWLRCKRRPELAFYLMNLWMRAWHEVPAGSIEADDDVLADAAMCSPEAWERIKGDVLQGWEERDGRWHHHVVTELAAEGLEKVEASRRRTEAARQARSQQRAVSATSNATSSVTENVTERVADDVTGSKEKKKGREEVSDAAASDAGEIQPEVETTPRLQPASVSMSPSPAIRSHADDFARFWQAYPHKVGKQDAEKAFISVMKRGAVPLDQMLAALDRYVRTKPPDRSWCNPGTWLRQGRWDDEPGTDPAPRGPIPPAPPGSSGPSHRLAAVADWVRESTGGGPAPEDPEGLRFDDRAAGHRDGDVLPLGPAPRARFTG
ncbi:hypothetical protein Xaut_3701 [Xanthobacter versatilis]|uniref:DUF1376 domain-containing protein n=1 Tax=Xanthobacter autotrophicus (strain ATCC BAA-1158 / Py2) TaxID=78245 RepID=A7ILN5_XANP2|nr:hypothetical protein Xaut_3701 [Xanthobacter autotrophicus Py2]